MDRIIESKIPSLLESNFQISQTDGRFHYLLTGYLDAKAGRKANLWDAIRDAEELQGVDREQKEEWIGEMQRLYERAYDLGLSNNPEIFRQNKGERYVTARKQGRKTPAPIELVRPLESVKAEPAYDGNNWEY